MYRPSNEYARKGESPLRKSPCRSAQNFTNSQTYIGGADERKNLDDRYHDLQSKWRYHESRLATEVALLKFNTPFEKREHSPSTAMRDRTTAAGSDLNCSCKEQPRGKSPLQDAAYRPASGYNACCHRFGDQCHGNRSMTRPNSLLQSGSHQVMPRERPSIAIFGRGDKHSVERSQRDGYPRRDSPLRSSKGTLVQRPMYELIEKTQMAESLQREIELRERRLADLAMQDRYLRTEERERERPLRRSSHSREKLVQTQPNVEIGETGEASLRRRKVVKTTAASKYTSLTTGADKEVDWLNQVDVGQVSSIERKNENSDQIGVPRSTTLRKRASDNDIEQSAPKSQLEASQLSLEYSESEQLQFSQPPLVNSLGPADVPAQIQESQHEEEELGEIDEVEENSSQQELNGGYMLHTVSLDPDAEQQHAALRQNLKNNFVKKTAPRTDPYEDKHKDMKKYSKRVSKDLRKVSGDPKQIKRMQQLTKKQLSLLKDEQLRQLYDEREVLRTQNEEIKRLEWLDNKVNHSYGQKNRHQSKTELRRPRSRKTSTRAFVHQGQYQGWTNTFKRMTKQWDDELGILDTEKKQVKSVKKLGKHPTRCCGNSPGKSHTNNCDFHDPMPEKKKQPKMALSFDAFTGKRIMTVVKPRMSSKARILKKAAKFAPYTQSSGKKNRVKSAMKKSEMGDSTGLREVLYNIDSKKQKVQMLQDNYTQQEQQALYNEHDDASKVAAIAEKIKELTQNTSDPAVRDQVLTESKVKFNNQIMTLKEFLGLCGHQMQESQNQLFTTRVSPCASEVHI